MTIIREYQNGNCSVKLGADGTKTREWKGTPKPEFPESIDLKVTNQCDAGCKFCHECSVPNGKHAKTDDILRLVEGLSPGVEIAIGGGNPLSHPYIVDIVRALHTRGLVPNMTIHSSTFYSMVWRSILKACKPYIYGLGVSGEDAPTHLSMWGRLCKDENVIDSNVVIHAIAGVDKPLEYMDATKLLILGFKRYGRGVSYYSPEVEDNLRRWRYWLKARLTRDAITSFDNLALEQLKVKDIVTPKQWKETYMGDDGSFTMFVDAVTNEYAVSSTSPKYPCVGRTIKELFQSIRRQA
jgi:hypothetical protein